MQDIRELGSRIRRFIEIRSDGATTTREELTAEFGIEEEELWEAILSVPFFVCFSASDGSDWLIDCCPDVFWPLKTDEDRCRMARQLKQIGEYMKAEGEALGRTASLGQETRDSPTNARRN